jgi:hypothetical protein
MNPSLGFVCAALRHPTLRFGRKRVFCLTVTLLEGAKDSRIDQAG